MALIAAIFIAVFIARKKRSPAAGHAKMDDGAMKTKLPLEHLGVEL